jgi:predicted HTH domain antitoxin
MQIALLAPIEERLTVPRAALHFAIGLYTSGEVTLGQAADVAGLSQTEFLHELGRRRIPLRYDRADFAEDIATLRELPGA